MNDQTPPKNDLPTYIDSSMLSTYRACPMRFYYTYILNKVPVGESIHLTAGSAFAAACDAVRKAQFSPANAGEALTPDQIALTAMPAFVKEWGDFQVAEDHPKNFHNVFNAFETYMRDFHPFTDQVQPYRLKAGGAASEFTFAIPLNLKHPNGDPFIFCGRFDLLGDFQGLPVILDEKTASRLSSPQKWELRGQFLGYCWACQVHGHKVNDVLIREIVLQKTQNQFQTIPIRFPQFMIDRWVDQLYLTLSRIILSYTMNQWDYNFGDSCASYNGCAYSQICTSHDKAAFLATYTDRTWTPLQHTSDI